MGEKKFLRLLQIAQQITVGIRQRIGEAKDCARGALIIGTHLKVASIQRFFIGHVGPLRTLSF